MSEGSTSQPGEARPKAFRHPLTRASVGLYPISASDGVSPSMARGLKPSRPALPVSVFDADGCTGSGEVWANFPPRANIHKAHLVEDVVALRLKGFTFIERRFAAEPIRADAGLSVWDHLAGATSIPLAGGENLYGVEEFLRLASAGLRYLQPDAAKWGGTSP